ncbi:TIGR02206 family membrane protein [bacterium]|nr:TIGR02206 family membrane protein [bacterium]
MSAQANIFSLDYPDHLFVFFSPSHWAALAVLICILSALWFIRSWFTLPHIDRRTRWIVASLLLLQELSLNIWHLSIGNWDAGKSLPLHLCGMGIVLAAFLLINRSYLLYELVYFWGLGGAIQALLTPDIGMYGFPHYRYFQFFLSHGTLIFASLYMTWIGGMRPTQRSIWKVMGITNIYLVIIAGFNLLTDGNYLFICHKPENGSFIDIMGPWPWYILVLEGVAIISFYIYYLPFALKDLIAKIR